MSRASVVSHSARPTSFRRSLLVGLAAAVALGACAGDGPAAPAAPSLAPAGPSLALASTCPISRGASLPDLIATIKGATPSATPSGIPGMRWVNVAGVVTNVGRGCAARFRIGAGQFQAQVEGSPTSSVEAFLELADTPLVDPTGFTKVVLLPGESVALTGRILVQSPIAEEWAAVRLYADACDLEGEAFLSVGCRIVESSETNNASAWALVPPR
jgi:hypothetical protein